MRVKTSVRRAHSILWLLIAVSTGTATADSQSPVRSVQGNTVVSQNDPAVRIVLPDDAAFVGSDSWMLYGITNCEQFVFVHADNAKNIERLYWIQFEAYVSSMPKLQYGYNSPRHVTLAGMDFYLDTWLSDYAGGTPQPPEVADIEKALAKLGYAIPDGINSGSDSQHVFNIVTTHGYTLPRKRINVRLVHLPGTGRRKELMYIYSEKFDGDTPSPQQMQEAIDRAERAITFSPLANP